MKSIQKPIAFVGSITLLLSMSSIFAETIPAYRLQEKWPLGETGKWDYLGIDPVRHRLFITRGTSVQVLDLPSGKLVGEIAKTNGVHGVAFAQDFKLGFTSNGRANTITVFDLDTLMIKQEIAITGTNPDAILYEPNSHKLFIFNGRTGNVTVIDAFTLKVLTTIEVGGKLEFAVSDEAGRIFFNIQDKAEIGVIDVTSNTLDKGWKLVGCDHPSGLAFDKKHTRLFSVCRNNIMAISDSITGKRVTDVLIGEHPDAVVYDSDSNTVFSSNGDGTLSVIRQIDADHYEVSEVRTANGARTMAMDHESKIIYLSTTINNVFTILVVAP